MMNPTVFTISAFALIFSLLAPFGSSYAEELETLQIEIKYTNGDRINAYQTTYAVYQDDDKTPILENPFETNPKSISLPQDHRYKVEVFVNGMFSEVGYVELKNTPKKLDINIPLPGGLKFNVFYEDGETPVDNAIVKIKSNDGEEQSVGNTNQNGETLRYWLQSTTTEEDFYIAEIYNGDFLLTSLSNIRINQGVPQDQKIVVPMPEIVEDLLTFRLYDTDSQKIVKRDGNFSILLSDQNDVKIRESKINAKGEIHFSSVPSGVYSASVLIDGLKDTTWKESKTTIIGNQIEFNLFQSIVAEPITESISVPISVPITEPISKPIIYDSSTKEYTLTCNCVSFRLDDVQDYWLNDVQTELISLFSKHNIPLTVGVIADSFGNDSKITDVVKNEIKNKNLYIANHGFGSTPFTDFDKPKQNEMLKESTIKIYEKLNVYPKIFIPPENKFNEYTTQVLLENGYTHLSASTKKDTPPFPLHGEDLYRFPEVATTGEYNPSQNRFQGISSDKTFSEALEGIDKYGFAVINMHPQEFSVFREGQYQNEINFDQIQELETLIERIKKENVDIVQLGEIDQNTSKNLISETYREPSNSNAIPTWVKNNAGWWRDGHIDDGSFVQGIQFLIKQEIIQIPPTTQGSGGSEIPNWIKNNAGWWAEGRISDNDFIFGVNYLVNQGIIVVEI